MNNNPFKLQQCGRAKCPLTTHGEDCWDRCRSEGVVYRAVCQICNQEQQGLDVEHSYEGETSRTLFTRSIQHLDDYRKAAKDDAQKEPGEDPGSSWMWDHVRDMHGGSINHQNPGLDFKFSLVSTHRDPLERQIKEAIRIESSFRGIVKKSNFSNENQSVVSLNRKGEYFASIQRYKKKNHN